MTTFAPQDDLLDLVRQRRADRAAADPMLDLVKQRRSLRPDQSALTFELGTQGVPRTVPDAPEMGWGTRAGGELAPHQPPIRAGDMAPRVPGSVRDGGKFPGPVAFDQQGREYDPANVLPTDVLRRQDERKYEQAMTPGVVGRMGALVAQGVDQQLREAGSTWENIGRRGLGALPDQLFLGGAPVSPPEEFGGIMSEETRSANDLRTEGATRAERFAAGLIELPAAFSDPKTIAAMLIAHQPGTAIGRAVFNERAMAAVESRFGPAVRQVVERTGQAATTGGTFGATDAALRGGSLSDIAEGATTAALTVVPFGLAGGAVRGGRAAMEGIRGWRERRAQRLARPAEPVQGAVEPAAAQPVAEANAQRTELRPAEENPPVTLGQEQNIAGVPAAGQGDAVPVRVPTDVDNAAVPPVPEAVPRSVVQSAPPAESVAKQPWEMTRDEFNKSGYYQHNILRPDAPDVGPEGFSTGIGPNAVLATSGPPTDIMQRRYRTLAGRPVYAVPPDAIVHSPNGPKIKEGWIPSERITPRYDYQPLHEAVVEQAIREGKPVPPEVLAEYPSLTAPPAQGVPSEDIRQVHPEGQPGLPRQPQDARQPEADAGAGPADKQAGQEQVLITDAHEVQRIKNSIAEGELILQTGQYNGIKYSKAKLDAVRRYVDSAKRKIGESASPEAAPAPLKPPHRMTNADLRAELEAAGVEIGDGNTRADLVKAVGQVRLLQMPTVGNAVDAETGGRPVPTGVRGRQPRREADAQGPGGEAPPSSPPPEAPARRPKRGEFSKADIERRLIAWQERSAYQRPGVELDPLTAEESSSDVLDTSFAGKLPGEVRDFVSGNPHLRRLFKENVPGGRAADVAASMGFDKYLERVAEQAEGKSRSAIRDAERAREHDPEAAVLMLIHDALPRFQDERKPYHIIDKPADLPDGTSFEIGGRKLMVKVQEGAGILAEADGAPIGWISEPIPIDAGSLRKPAPQSRERSTPAQPGLLGERFDETRVVQKSLIDTAANEGSRLDAEQASRDQSKAVDEETTPMFEEAKWHHGKTLGQLRAQAREVGARDRGTRAELIAAIEEKRNAAPPAPEPPPSGPRQSYQFTRDEWTARAKSEAQRESMGLQHEKMVRKAVREGKDVPAGVLKDYPDLQRKGGGSSSGLASPMRELPAAPGSIKPTRIQPDPLQGEAKQVSEIMVDLQKGLGQVRAGASARGSLGTYYPASSKTIVRFTGDLDTAAHEVAHRLDDLYGIVADWATPKGFNKRGAKIPQKSPFDKELRADIFQQTSREHYSTVMKRAEGVAEYLRAWMLNPQEAARQAPAFTKFFESKVPAEARARIRAFGDDVRTWAGSGALKQAASNIRFEFQKPGMIERAREAFEGEGVGGDFLTKMNAATLDALAPVWKGVELAKKLRGIEDLVPSRDPRVRLRLFAGFDRKAMDVLAHGPITFEGERVANVGGIDWLLEPLKSDSKAALEADMKTLYGFMTSQRVVERVGRIRDAVRDVNRLSMEIEQLKADGADAPGMMGSGHDRLIEALKERREAMRSVGYHGAPHRMSEWASTMSQRMSGAGAGVYSDYSVAKEAIKMAENDPERFARIQEAAKRHRAWSDAVLQYMVDGGRISEQAAKKIRDGNEFYVAMKRLNETVSSELYPGGSGGKRLASARQPIKQFVGSTKEIENPFVSLIGDTYEMMRETDRNAAILSFVRLLDEQREMYQGKPVDFDQIGSRATSGDADAIKVYRGGDLEHWQFAPAIHKGLQNWGISKSPDLLAKAIQSMTRFMRNTITLAPQFIIRQQFRDPLARGVISRSGTKPWEQFYFLTPEGRAEFAQIKSEFDRAGGGLFGHRLVSRKNYYARMRDALKEASGDGNTILSVPGKIARAYTTMAEAGETINRLAEYRRAYNKARNSGMGEVDAKMQAAFEARDLQDFAVAGTFTRALNDYVPFTAAAVRGLARTVESAVERPGRFAARWATYIASLELAHYAWNYYTGAEKDERELSPYRRDFFWNLKLGDWGWLSIPKPYELGVMGSGLTRVLDASRGVEDPFKGYASSFFQAASPLESGDLLGPLQPIVSVMSNHDFFTEKPIVPQWEMKQEPGHRKGELRASKVGQLLGQWLGVDARYVDQFIRSQLGGFGTLLTKAINPDEPWEGLQDAGAAASGILYRPPAR